MLPKVGTVLAISQERYVYLSEFFLTGLYWVGLSGEKVMSHTSEHQSGLSNDDSCLMTVLFLCSCLAIGLLLTQNVHAE